MKSDDMNPFLDDLFAEARAEAPVHSFANTRKTLLAGLAIGGGALIGAKFITSSILKTKFFIMSISTVAIITSAALVYTTGLKPTETVSENVNRSSVTYAVAAPENNELPDNLFIPVQEVEPEDTTIVIKRDSIVDVQEIINEVMESLNLEALEGTIEEALETISHVHIDFDSDDLEGSVQDILDTFDDIDIDIDEEDFEELKVLMADFSADSLKMQELMRVVEELELAGIKLGERAQQLNSDSRVIVVNRRTSSEKSDGLTRRVFSITNETTDLDLGEFNKMATAAGMDVQYKCTVWSSKIRSLDMQLAINSDNGSQKTEIQIKRVKRKDCFAYNIIWYEDANGQAVKLSTSTEGANNAHLQHNRHNKTTYYNGNCKSECEDNTDKPINNQYYNHNDTEYYKHSNYNNH